MIYTVEVAVALERPPHEHEWRKILVEAEDPTEAQLVALQMASCTSTMPVYASNLVEAAQSEVMYYDYAVKCTCTPHTTPAGYGFNTLHHPDCALERWEE